MKKHGNRLIRAQIMAKYEARCCRKRVKHYDVGISFLEFWPCEYLIYQVNAEKKIGWIHVDVKEAGLLPQLSEDSFRKLDTVVLVSQSCLRNFQQTYPQFAQKAICIANILSDKTIRALAKEPASVHPCPGKLHLVSVCRIVLVHKGLDRGIEAFKRLHREGLLQQLDWYIIGDGPDRPVLEDMIRRSGLDKHIFLLGQQINPYHIEKSMDVFFLPSRYEGKPMAVTEAQMLGLVPVVSNYSSAKSQVSHGVDGVIMENSDDAPYHTLKALVEGKFDLDSMKEQVRNKNYSNIEEIECFYEVIEPAAGLSR